MAACVTKALQCPGQVAHCGVIAGLHLDKPTDSIRRIEQRQHLIDHIVDVDQAQRTIRVVDSDRQAPRDVVAKGCNDGVVVRAAPFSKHVGQPKNIDRYTALPTVVLQHVFSGSFASAIAVVQHGLRR